MKIILLISSFLFACCKSENFDVVENNSVIIENDEKFGSAKIAFGDSADIEDFSYMLAMIDQNGGFVCGASVIHKLWALSAGHCLESRKNQPNLISFRGGSKNRQSGGKVFKAEKILLHPKFDSLYLAFDLGLIKVLDSTPLEGLNIKPIALPKNCNEICCGVCADILVTVSGWGSNEEVDIPINLAQMTSTVVDYKSCANLWLNSMYRMNVGPDYFCMKVLEGKGTCRGDSGSPIITGHGEYKTQVGLVSFGTHVCGETYALPSGLVRIEYSPVRDWIREVSGV